MWQTKFITSKGNYFWSYIYDESMWDILKTNLVHVVNVETDWVDDVMLIKQIRVDDILLM